MIRRVAFIGFGLIGSSLARVLREKQLASSIVAYTRSLETRTTALDIGLIDEAADSIEAAATHADVIVLAMPVGLTEQVLHRIAPVMSEQAVLTDVGSTKQNVVDAARQILNPTLLARFVPGHPIAGAEQTGVLAGRADLFFGHKVILTPLETTHSDATQLITQLWQKTGADVITMDVARHDEVLAQTSHLPHLLAYTLVEQLAGTSDNLDVFRFAAGGFRDFTRIAASDALMWRDIFVANKFAILSAIGQFEVQLAHIKSLLNAEDGQTELIGLLSHAQQARQHFGHMINRQPYMETNQVSEQFILSPGGKMKGQISVPGDKSVSHRSIMFGALAEGITTVSGFLEGEDALATLQAFRDMGVVIEGPHHGEVVIHGVGLYGLKAPSHALYMGNSGTSMRLLSGILSTQSFDSVLTGDISLSKRPMERVAKPLRQMGAVIQTTGERGTPPVSIKGNAQLHGIHYDLPVASAQVKSAILLAALWAEGTTSITEPEMTRDHTERMLRAFGYTVDVQGHQITLTGQGKLTATHIPVPADISSAAFFMVAASIAPDSDVLLKQVGINPTRTGVIEILKLMGADLTLSNEQMAGGEPIADIRIRYAPLHGIHIPKDQVPLAIDEFPALFIAAACAQGETVLTGAAELRVKESDRIAVMATGLQTLGIDCTPTPDGMIIRGRGGYVDVFGGGVIQSHHDHRIAMSFAIAALRARGDIVIEGTQTVATSFPNFVSLAKQCGLQIHTHRDGEDH